MDVNTLIEEKMGRLILAARKLSRNFGVPDLMEDLIQEGSLALMEAAGRYDTSGDASFDAYSDRIIKSAMHIPQRHSIHHAAGQVQSTTACRKASGGWRRCSGDLR